MINKKFTAERTTDKRVITQEQPNQTTEDTKLHVRVKRNLGKFLCIQGGTNSHELIFFFPVSREVNFSFSFLNLLSYS